MCEELKVFLPRVRVKTTYCVHTVDKIAKDFVEREKGNLCLVVVTNTIKGTHGSILCKIRRGSLKHKVSEVWFRYVLGNLT